jgi:hypothetical protein
LAGTGNSEVKVAMYHGYSQTTAPRLADVIALRGAMAQIRPQLDTATARLRPLLLERGKPVKQRTADTFGFWRGERPFQSESNAQFGEGGAGTFSDGKLYSQISEPAPYARKVLEELVAAGAHAEILTKHRPHIGTFKLATVSSEPPAARRPAGGLQSAESRAHTRRKISQGPSLAACLPPPPLPEVRGRCWCR